MAFGYALGEVCGDRAGTGTYVEEAEGGVCSVVGGEGWEEVGDAVLGSTPFMVADLFVAGEVFVFCRHCEVMIDSDDDDDDDDDDANEMEGVR